MKVGLNNIARQDSMQQRLIIQSTQYEVKIDEFLKAVAAAAAS